MPRSTVYFIILVVTGVIILGLQGYLFYFADCQTVKDNWLSVPVPGRCILIPVSSPVLYDVGGTDFKPYHFIKFGKNGRIPHMDCKELRRYVTENGLQKDIECKEITSHE